MSEEQRFKEGPIYLQYDTIKHEINCEQKNLKSLELILIEIMTTQKFKLRCNNLLPTRTSTFTVRSENLIGLYLHIFRFDFMAYIRSVKVKWMEDQIKNFSYKPSAGLIECSLKIVR